MLMNYAAAIGCRVASGVRPRSGAAAGQLEQELGVMRRKPKRRNGLGIPVAEYRQMLLDTNNSQLFLR